MKHSVSSNDRNLKLNAGFTLIELIVVIGFFAFITALLMNQLFAVYHFRDMIRAKKELNFESTALLNNGLPGLIRSGFAINYAKTKTHPSTTPSSGWQEEVDQLSIYTDRAETQYFTLYRKPYQKTGENADTAPLYLAFSNGQEFPLHSSEMVVEAFQIQLPEDPRLSGDRDTQPYVQIYLRVRKRFAFGEVVDESSLPGHKIIRTSYRTTLTLRNSGPGQYKNPLS